MYCQDFIHSALINNKLTKCGFKYINMSITTRFIKKLRT